MPGLLPGFPTLAAIGLGKQSAYSTTVSPVTWFAWETIAKFEPMLNTEAYPDGAGRHNVYQARIGAWFEFDFTTQLRPSACMQALAYFLGTTDTLGHVTGTMTSTTTSGATNISGAVNLVVASTTNAAVGDILLVSQVVGSLLSEYVIVKTVTDATHLALVLPLVNTYAAASTVANAVGASLYAHAGSSAEANLPTVTMFYAFGYNSASNTALDFINVGDCVFSDFDMMADGGAHAKVNIKGFGRVTTPGQSAPTVTVETDRSLTFIDGVYSYNGLTVTGGTADTTSVHINIKNTITRQPVAGTAYPRLWNGHRETSLEFKLFVEDNKPFRDVFYGGDTNTVLSATNTVAPQLVFRFDYGNASADHLVQFYCNNVVLRTAQPTFDANAGPLIFTFTGNSLKSSPSGTALPDFQYLALNADTTAY